MNVRKLISLCALITLLVAQVAIAQHSTIHVNHDVSLHQEASDQSANKADTHSDNEEQSKQHQCPECFLTKTLQSAFYNQEQALFPNRAAETDSPAHRMHAPVKLSYNANTARAPPRFLI
jgi:hypothetical protein